MKAQVGAHRPHATRSPRWRRLARSDLGDCASQMATLASCGQLLLLALALAFKRIAASDRRVQLLGRDPGLRRRRPSAAFMATRVLVTTVELRAPGPAASCGSSRRPYGPGDCENLANGSNATMADPPALRMGARTSRSTAVRLWILADGRDLGDHGVFQLRAPSRCTSDTALGARLAPTRGCRTAPTGWFLLGRKHKPAPSSDRPSRAYATRPTG
jgi:hypothetical protein